MELWNYGIMALFSRCVAEIIKKLIFLMIRAKITIPLKDAARVF